MKQIISINHQSKNWMKNILRNAFALILVVTTLSGCATAIVAGVAITTVDIIHDRRSIGEYIDDGGIEFAAKNVASSEERYRKGVHLKAQSWNGILLLTGEIESIELKRELLPQLSEIRGVRQIVDETTINSKSRFNSIANDAWISGKVKSRLILKTGLNANRVKIVTTQGSVYLMGIVTREEADKATEHASAIRGVKRVVRVFEYKQKKAKN